jgi:hypothetical protein
MPSPHWVGCAFAVWLAATGLRAHELPEPGRCPPYPVHPGDARPQEERDALPAEIRAGEKLDLGALRRIRFYLPPEVWQRRKLFFFEGQELEIGPCHRRYLPPHEFEEATREGAGRARVDREGNLRGWSGTGLPFAPSALEVGDPQAGAKWAWNYRYRYLGSGFRGAFEIRHVSQRRGSADVFAGEFFVQPFYGLTELAALDSRRTIAAGGRFTRPALARGLAWRQFVSPEADREPNRSDDVFVWLPASRRTKRAPPAPTDGLYVPDYTQARAAGTDVFQMPDVSSGAGHADLGQAALAATRRGFTGLLLRPNTYEWRVERFQDVLAPINVRGALRSGERRSWGPSGLSLASERWDLRRAAVLRGVRRDPSNPVRELDLYVDAQTFVPLYLITRSGPGSVFEVVIFAGRFSADDPLAAAHEGAGDARGLILPVAQSAWVAGDASWVRESFELRTDIPDRGELRELLSTRQLGRER